MVCPPKAGVLLTMAIQHIEKHVIQNVHQRSSQRKSQQATTPIPGLEENLQWKKAPTFAFTPINPTVSPHNSKDLYMDADMPDVNMEVPLSELLNHIADDRTPEPEFDRAHLDLFAC
jgi:hypothetical protein